MGRESEELSLHGGEPVIECDDPEQWTRDVERERKILTELLEEGAVSGSGTGLPREFERDFRAFVKSEYCLTVDHGATALASAYYAVGVGPGDEVLTPVVGYIGSYAGALHMGARPVFCEVDPETLLVDPDDIEAKITDRTKAISVIHKGGRVCDMDRILEISERHDVPVVEDAAHAHGAEWGDTKVGNIGDVTCFSLQGVNPDGKPVAGGEGGIVTTSDRAIYERMLAYCHLHRDGVTDELTMPEYSGIDAEVLGLKWRAHPLALALATVSLDSLEYRNARRRNYRSRLFEELAELPGMEPVETYSKSNSAGLYGWLNVKYRPEGLDGLSVEKFIQAVEAEGVNIRGPGFHYLEHLRTIFTDGLDLWGDDRGPLGGEFCGLPPFEPYQEGDFPVAERIDETLLKVDCYVEPIDGYVEQVIAAFEKVINNRTKLN